MSEELLVAIGLIQRHEGVNVGKLPPGDRLKKERTAVSLREFSFPKLLHLEHEKSTSVVMGMVWLFAYLGHMKAS